MIKILDKYLLGKFLKTFVFVTVMLVFVVVVIDYTEKNDKYINHGLSALEISKYYLTFIPWIASFLTPITAFIATVFVTSALAAKTEIVAILASGVSFLRMLRPYFAGAIIIAAFSFALNGYIIPDANKFRVGFEVEYLRRPFYFKENDVHIKVKPDVYLYLQRYDSRKQTAYKVTLENIVGDELVAKLHAKSISWNDSSASWTLNDWWSRSIVGMDEYIEKGEKKDTVINITPDDFGDKYSSEATMNMKELEAHIELQRSRGADDVQLFVIEKYIRYMQPFGILILTFMGVIISARKSRGGTGLQIAVGFLLAFVYIIFFVTAKAIAESNSMHPMLAIWIPNITFSLVSLFMYFTVPR